MKKQILTVCLTAALLLAGCSRQIETNTTASASEASSQLTASDLIEQQEEDSSAASTPVQEPEIEPLEPAVAWDETEAGDWCFLLVNAITPTDVDYSGNLVSYNADIQVDSRILSPLTAMMKAADADGVSIFPCSSYRSIERSAYLYQQQIERFLAKGYSEEKAKIAAAHWVAPPGTSEHNTGLALDFLSNDCTEMNDTFADSEAGKWLYAHAAEYGFILRYPEGKEDVTGITFEPWHYRYVGSAAAAEIMQKGLCLEEYLGAPEVGYERVEDEE